MIREGCFMEVTIELRPQKSTFMVLILKMRKQRCRKLNALPKESQLVITNQASNLGPFDSYIHIL